MSRVRCTKLLVDSVSEREISIFVKQNIYSKTCVKWPLKNRQLKTKIFMTNGSLIKVKRGAFCNTFDLHEVINSLENQFLVFLRVAILHKFYCTIKYCHFIIFHKKYTVWNVKL